MSDPDKPSRLEAPDAATVAELHAMSERRLSAEEFDAYVRAPMSDDERAEILAQIAWFMRRYPTPAERLAAARRSYAQWARSMPRGG